MTGERRQLSRDELRIMSADEILAAREAGQLDDILAGRDPVRVSEVETRIEEGPTPSVITPPASKIVRPAAGEANDVFHSEESGAMVSREQLRGMSPEEIMKAYEEGRLDRLRRGDDA